MPILINKNRAFFYLIAYRKNGDEIIHPYFHPFPTSLSFLLIEFDVDPRGSTMNDSNASLLTPEKAAEFLGLSTTTLSTWRTRPAPWRRPSLYPLRSTHSIRANRPGYIYQEWPASEHERTGSEFMSGKRFINRTPREFTNCGHQGSSSTNIDWRGPPEMPSIRDTAWTMTRRPPGCAPNSPQKIGSLQLRFSISSQRKQRLTRLGVNSSVSLRKSWMQGNKKRAL